jgi:lipocalin
MEYSTIKNNDFMKFSGKWMELKNIPSEVTQSQKSTHGIYSLINGY